ncbi:cyclase family protein [Peterkaempfera bronchialis]|uniref:Cyclase family protein n=1 Tax=Peterkaempfera bronchialis TaxID=2126346 RepID=A0A345SZ44_9ACTN|nr:cyclase family protein [Peterkaempfera bronchialis]AXI78999.1 cyclase family protein [Peterkaempfera bronchialis]
MSETADAPTTLVDLSVPVFTGMPVYPGDPEVSITGALRTAEDGVNVLRLHLGSQTGTHIDAPYHVDDTWPTLEGLPLDRFTGPAVVADLRGLAPRTAVTPDHLAAALPRLGPGVVLLLCTGWSAHWETDHYLAHPWLTPQAAQAVVDTGVRTVAVDALSVDRTPDPADPPADFSLAAHRILCGAGAVIAENLTNLPPLLTAQSAGRPIEVSLFPLRLTAADGAPTRAVARIS